MVRKILIFYVHIATIVYRCVMRILVILLVDAVTQFFRNVLCR